MNFEIEFDGSGPEEILTSFNSTVGQMVAHDPIGPDNYGYYCLDNTDIEYADHPTYNWIDINTSWSYVSLSDDDVATILLPFTVKYFGQDYSQISICDNGYLAMGQTWMANFYNAPIPGPQDAFAMIAPFWDDFSQTTLHVYYHYDSTTGVFIIGYRNALLNDGSSSETFELMIYDQSLWPTRTGDNEIVFQYSSLMSPIGCTVGICSPDRRDGIQYVHNGVNTTGAAPLANGRAIKFTTLAGNAGCDYVPGDINGNGHANGIDVTYGVNFFKGSSAPPFICDCPNHGDLFIAGDINNSCSFNGIDISYMVNFYKGGASFIPCTDCPPAGHRLAVDK
jgi:hypothetical protein